MYGCHASVVGHTGWVARLQPVVGNQKFRRIHRDRACAPDWVVYGVRCERTGTCVRKRRFAAYWETLGRLNEEQTRDPSPRGTVSRQSRRLRLKPTEMGSAAGVGVSVMFAENFRTRNSLTLFQQGLGKSDLLLGFSLGKPAGDRLGAALYQRLLVSIRRTAHGGGSFAGWGWTTTGVAWPIQILERTAARRDNCLQALSAERWSALVAMTGAPPAPAHVWVMDCLDFRGHGRWQVHEPWWRFR